MSILQAVMPWLSLVGAAGSAVLSLSVWLLRVRRERPNLRAHLANAEFFLGNGDAETRQIGVKVGIIVANYSTLPDAVLNLRAKLQQSDGAWINPERIVVDSQTPLPCNLSALNTTIVRVTCYLRFPASAGLEEGRPLPAYLARYLPDQRCLHVELLGLNDRIHSAVVSFAGEPRAGEMLRAA